LRVLVAGGTGFMGSAVRNFLESAGHEVWVLTRQAPRAPREIKWNGRSVEGWGERLSEMDAVVNTTGFGLEHWPWTPRQKQRFLDSRVLPSAALVSAIVAARRRPRVLVQISGINFYGARGEGIADESWPAADDYLAQLTVRWEAASQPIEGLGVRRVIARSAVVLDARRGLFPIMALPIRLFVGGPLGDGRQAVPWIHINDQVRALQFLLENQSASGAFNLIAPEPTSNQEFMREVAHSLRRPYWFKTPGFVLWAILGEMSTLVLDGRYSQPHRLVQLGFDFKFPTIRKALQDLFRPSEM
jgi:uncharacterized protein